MPKTPSWRMKLCVLWRPSRRIPRRRSLSTSDLKVTVRSVKQTRFFFFFLRSIQEREKKTSAFDALGVDMPRVWIEPDADSRADLQQLIRMLEVGDGRLGHPGRRLRHKTHFLAGKIAVCKKISVGPFDLKISRTFDVSLFGNCKFILFFSFSPENKGKKAPAATRKDCTFLETLVDGRCKCVLLFGYPYDGELVRF